MSGPLDPRIAWQRALVADHELNRTARGIGVMVGAQLSYSGLVSIGIGQLVTLTGHSDKTVKRGLAVLRAAGWLHLQQRGYRGRTSTYRADSPGFVLRSEVVTGAEYRSWGPPTSPEYGSPETPNPAEYRSPGPPISPEYGSPETPSHPNRGHQDPPSFTYEELRTYVPRPPTNSRPSAAQAPALAVAPDPDTTAVLDGLPLTLRPRSTATRRRLAGLIGQRLVAGWSVEQLVECTAGLGPVAIKDPPAFWASLVPTTPPEAAQGRPRRPSWCGQCDEATRLVELDDNTAARCPRCHPSAEAALA